MSNILDIMKILESNRQRGFLMNTNNLTEDIVEKIAKVAHEVNRAYCVAIYDNSKAPWEQTPELLRNSTKSGIRHLAKNPDINPQQAHEEWLAYKVKEGWIYGRVIDNENKKHPCLVPYNELSQADKVKDNLFRAIVKNLLELHL